MLETSSRLTSQVTMFTINGTFRRGLNPPSHANAVQIITNNGVICKLSLIVSTPRLPCKFTSLISISRFLQVSSISRPVASTSTNKYKSWLTLRKNYFPKYLMGTRGVTFSKLTDDTKLAALTQQDNAAAISSQCHVTSYSATKIKEPSPITAQASKHLKHIPHCPTRCQDIIVRCLYFAPSCAVTLSRTAVLSRWHNMV